MAPGTPPWLLRRRYYVLQVIHEPGPKDFPKQSRYHVFRKWGRVGTTIGGSKIERMPKHDAVAEFERLFLDKARAPP